MTTRGRVGELGTYTWAADRIRQKIDFLTKKIEADPLAKASFWSQQDIDCFQLAVECLEYAQAMKEYEESRSSL